MSAQNDITYFGETDFRGQKRRFGIKQEDRQKHTYVIGKTGMGKSTLLENMAVQDIKSGKGLGFIDPHGKTAEILLDYVPEERIDDVIYFAPFDLEHPISFNVMEDVGYEKRHLVANGLMAAFKKIWVDAWSARMEYILNNTLLALLEYPDSTLIGVNRMLADKTYRKRVVANITDVAVKSFWQDEFAQYSERYMTEAGAAIQNKIGQFISNPLIRNIIGQSNSSFDIREIMDDRKILIMNLSKGKVGQDNANLLGSMLITKIYLAAMSRADVSPYEMDKLANFYFFVDEFQSFANESFSDILSEARKYKLNLTIAHQYIEQMTDEVRAAVFGNVGTIVTFRIGANDAEHLEKEFAPVFTADDIVNLGFAQVYLRLMIDGVASKPFSATTLPPIQPPQQSYRDLIIARSRQQFAAPRKKVEDLLIDWHESSAGILNDPQVMRAKEKLNQVKDKQIESYKNSRESLDKVEKELKIPRPPKKLPSGQNNDTKSNSSNSNPASSSGNQRLQTAISKSSMKSRPKPPKGEKKSKNELRSALADALKDAGIKVDDLPEGGKSSQKINDTNSNKNEQEGKQKNTQPKPKQNDQDNWKSSTKKNKDNSTLHNSQGDDSSRNKAKKNKKSKKEKKKNNHSEKSESVRIKSENTSSNQREQTSSQKDSNDQSHHKHGQPESTSQSKIPNQNENGRDSKEEKSRDSNTDKNAQNQSKGEREDRQKLEKTKSGAAFEIPEDELKKMLQV